METSPAARRRNRVREKILAAAEKVFAHEGADGLSIRRLAETIDYSPAAIYKYFKSKEDLVDELKEAFFARILVCVNEAVDTEVPFAERARRMIMTYVQIAIEKPHHYAAAFAGQYESVGPAEDEPGFEDTNKGQAFYAMRGMVKDGIELDLFRADLDVTLAAKSLWASCHGLAMMMVHLPRFPEFKPIEGSFGRDEFIAMHADLLIRGLETPK